MRTLRTNGWEGEREALSATDTTHIPHAEIPDTSHIPAGEIPMPSLDRSIVLTYSIAPTVAYDV